MIHGQRAPLHAYLHQARRGAWRCDSPSAPSGRVEAVPLVFPRRIRTILDPRMAEFPPSCRLGDLTVDGMAQIEDLGKSYRSYLGSFLSEQLNPDEIVVRAASEDRNVKSGMAFLRGLYKPRTMDEIIDITTGTASFDVLRPDTRCPEIKELQDMYLQSDTFKALMSEMERDLASVKKLLNVSKWDFESAQSACEWVSTTWCNGELFDAEINETQANLCRTARAKMMYGVYFFNNDRNMIAFSYGMREMVRLLNSFLAQETKAKLVLLNAEESTMVALLALLEHRLDAIPPFGSHIQMQLLRSDVDQNHYIRFVMNGEAIRQNVFGKYMVRVEEWLSLIMPRISGICEKLE